MLCIEVPALFHYYWAFFFRACPNPYTSAAVCGSQGYAIVEVMLSLAHKKNNFTQ